MNSELHPYPPLGVIEDRLFGGADAVNSPSVVGIAEEVAEPTVQLPVWLREQIGQLAAQRAQHLPAEPAAGQIWSVAYRGERDGREVAGRIPMLLDCPAEAGVWQGWLVSGDTDYASRADVIIDTREFGIAPAACMVQTWNRVEALRDDAAPYLGQLDPDMLAAIRAVAAEGPAARPEEGVPGMLGRREVGEGVFVLTGQDLGSSQDPRWGYRRLYYELSAMLPELAPGHDYDD